MEREAVHQSGEWMRKIESLDKGCSSTAGVKRQFMVHEPQPRYSLQNYRATRYMETIRTEA